MTKISILSMMTEIAYSAYGDLRDLSYIYCDFAKDKCHMTLFEDLRRHRGDGVLSGCSAQSISDIRIRFPYNCVAQRNGADVLMALAFIYLHPAHLSMLGQRRWLRCRLVYWVNQAK